MSIKDFTRKALPMPIWARMSWMRHYWLIGEWELRELSHLVARSPGGGRAIDVGANLGLYSYALKRIGYQVVSFEPDQICHHRLRALLGRSACIETVALSNIEGVGTMRVPAVGGEYAGGLASLSEWAVPDGDILTSYEIELRSLDSYGFNDVAFIKIDVEGHEEAVLEGAIKTLKLSKPVLLIEIEERHNPGALGRIANRLADIGYSGFFYYERKRFALSEFVPELHQDPHLVVDHIARRKNNRRSLKYVNNFVFYAS